MCKEEAGRPLLGMTKLHRGSYIGIILGLYWVMEKKMETTITF